MKKGSRRLVPLISSRAVGILGILHLIRMWWKLSLEARGKLAPGYPGAGLGFDQMVFDGIGLNREATINHIRATRPGPVEFELWVKEKAVNLNPESVAALNAKIRDYIHTDETRHAIFDLCGLTDGNCLLRDGLSINELEDWALAHKAEILTKKGRKTQKAAPIAATSETTAQAKDAAAGTTGTPAAPADEHTAGESTSASGEVRSEVIQTTISTTSEQASGNGSASAEAEGEKGAEPTQPELPGTAGSVETPIVAAAANSPTKTGDLITQQSKSEAPVAAE